MRNFCKHFHSFTRLIPAILAISFLNACGGGNPSAQENQAAATDTPLPAELVGVVHGTEDFRVHAIIGQGEEVALQNLQVDPIAGTWSGTLELPEGSYAFTLVYYIRSGDGEFVAVAKTNPTTATNISAGQNKVVNVGAVPTSNYVDTDNDGTPNLTEITRGSDWQTMNVSPEPENILLTPLPYNIEVAWDPLLGASAYNIYMSSEPGITSGSWKTKKDGMLHSDVESPFTHGTPLSPLNTYCFVITAFNKVGESIESEEACIEPDSPNTGNASPLFSVGNAATGIVSSPGYDMEYSLGEPIIGTSTSTNFRIMAGIPATDPETN